MARRSVLVVDDEESLLKTLSAILVHHGFEVTAASNVPDAIQAISTTRFDILITDLNIGEPGDGFTVVSALRRVQPDALTLILTGFPAFDTALQAIRDQVDDYLVKPIQPDQLVDIIERTIISRQRHTPMPRRRASEVIRSERNQIVTVWLARLRAVRSEPNLMQLTDAELIDHLPSLVDELCRRVDTGATSTAPDAVEKAKAHGQLRAKQGFSQLFLLHESSQLRREVLNVVHRNLLALNLSYLFADLSLISDSVDDQLRISLDSYLKHTRIATHS